MTVFSIYLKYMKRCSAPKCKRVYKWGAYCSMHKARLQRSGTLQEPKRKFHGKVSTPEYGAWKSMRQRCHNPNNPSYSYYGGRGILVHEAWRDNFSEFYKDILNEIGERPTDGHTLDRIDNDGNYEPGNLRWATRYEQGANQRSNHLITYRDRTQTLSQWARELGISRPTLSYRIHRSKWPLEKALEVKVGR